MGYLTIYQSVIRYYYSQYTECLLAVIFNSAFMHFWYQANGFLKPIAIMGRRSHACERWYSRD